MAIPRPKRKDLDVFIPRPNTSTSAGVAESIRPSALKEGEAFAFGSRPTGEVTGVATNVPSASKFLPQAGFQRAEDAVRPPIGAAEGAGILGAVPRPKLAGGVAPRPEVDADINPLGRPMSTLETFNRRKILNNPNAFSPTERRQVLGGIAEEKRQAGQTQAAEAEGVAREQSIQDDIRLQAAKDKSKGDQDRQTDIDSAALKADAATIAEGREVDATKLAFTRAGELNEQNAKIASAALADNLGRRGVDVTNVATWDAKQSTEIAKDVETYKLEHELDDVTAKREYMEKVMSAMISAPNSRYKTPSDLVSDLPIVVEAVYGKSNANDGGATATGTDNPADLNGDGKVDNADMKHRDGELLALEQMLLRNTTKDGGPIASENITAAQARIKMLRGLKFGA